MATDPVCGMYVEERSTSLRLVRDNRTYYFCCESCLRQFAGPEDEMRRLVRRLEVAWPLALAVLVLTYGPFEAPAVLGAAALATVLQVYAGFPFYRGLRDAAKDRTWNMDVLIAVGTTAAYAYSIAALALPSRLPHAYYFDASALILTLILTGNYLEHRTRRRAGSALRRLEELLPETALVVGDGAARPTRVAELAPGDRLRVRPGERFPADGTIESGRTEVDESILTGEPLPRPRGPGDPVLAGSMNGDGAVEVRVTGAGPDTFVAEIGRLLTDAEISRVPLQRTADRIAAVFVPVVLVLAVASGSLWYLLGGVGFTVALLVFVSVAITACPCAFGIATPAAIVVGTGRAAEAGILYRGEDAIERASRVDLVVADKTGTLTVGRPVLVNLRVESGVSEEHALAVAAALESHSTHPLAAAVVDAARARHVAVPEAVGVRAVPGRGLRGTVAGVEIEVVRPEVEERLRDSGRTALAPGAPMREEGTTLAEVHENARRLATLAFSDVVSEGARDAVAALAADGIPVVMATGDRLPAAQRVAAEVGIARVHAGLTPAGKLDLLARLRSEGHVVAFVGDGINDAPALAGADLGIAIGTGTAVAREAGQVLLVRADLRGVPLALRLARRTVGRVRGNLAWAIGYNAVLLPATMGALVPIFGLGVYQVLPIAGAAAMGLSSTTVVANSLSLRWVSLRAGRRAGASERAASA